MEGLEGMGNVSLICFLLLLSFVGKLDVVLFFPKLGDSPFLASFGLLAIFPLTCLFVCLFVFMYF